MANVTTQAGLYGLEKYSKNQRELPNNGNKQARVLLAPRQVEGRAELQTAVFRLSSLPHTGFTSKPQPPQKASTSALFPALHLSSCIHRNQPV